MMWPDSHVVNLLTSVCVAVRDTGHQSENTNYVPMPRARPCGKMVQGFVELHRPETFIAF
jgi:hypothetical protein